MTGRRVFLSCTQFWVCALHKVWVVIYMRPPSEWWREKLSSSSQAVSYDVQIPPDGFSTQTAAFTTVQAEPALTNPRIKLTVSFSFTFKREHIPAPDPLTTLSYTSTATTQRVSEAVCVYKDNKCPWAVITDCILTVETHQYISCNVSSAPKNTSKTTTT